MPVEYLDPFIETLGREALEQIQLKRFQLMVGQLLESNSFYRAKLTDAGLQNAQDIKSFDDYRRLPLTTKTELSVDQIDHPPYGTNMTYEREHYTRIHQTSGTTGQPLRLLDTAESWRWWARCWATVFRAAGVTQQDRIFFAFSFGPFIGFWSAYEGAREIGALVIPSGGMSSHQRLEHIAAHEATVVVCTPTYALHLSEVAEESGVDLPGSSVRVTIHAGEPGAGLPATRARIQAAWGARCHDHAGATEVGAWGFDDEGQDGLYVNEGEFIAEVLDPETGNPTEDGELVITNLGRIGMPVIRYRTGDRVKIQPKPGVSGRTFVRFDQGVIGRIDDATLVRGVNVYPSAIENIIRRFPEIGEYAVDVYRRAELDDMEIRMEVSKGAPDVVGAAVARQIRNVLGVRVVVNPVAHGTLPRYELKARRFTDHRERKSHQPK